MEQKCQTRIQNYKLNTEAAAHLSKNINLRKRLKWEGKVENGITRQNASMLQHSSQPISPSVFAYTISTKVKPVIHIRLSKECRSNS